MAKEGFAMAAPLEPYCRHDPVSGQLKCFYRVRHDRIRSPRLRDYDACMHQALEGREYRGHGAREDTRRVRQALREAAKACAAHDSVRTSG